MMAALGTHVGVLGQPALVEDLATGVALDPDVGGQLPLLGDELLLGLLEPGHPPLLAARKSRGIYRLWWGSSKGLRQASADARATIASPTNRVSRKLPP